MLPAAPIWLSGPIYGFPVAFQYERWLQYSVIKLKHFSSLVRFLNQKKQRNGLSALCRDYDSVLAPYTALPVQRDWTSFDVTLKSSQRGRREMPSSAENLSPSPAGDFSLFRLQSITFLYGGQWECQILSTKWIANLLQVYLIEYKFRNA